MKLKNRKMLDVNKIMTNIEDFAYKKIFYISLICSLIIVIFYYCNLLENIKSIIGNVITFTSIVFAIISIFLTLYIYLEDSSLGERKKDYYPEIDIEIYEFLRKVIYSTVVTLLLSLLISVMKFESWVVIKLILGFITGFVFVYMTIGMVYIIKFSIGLAISSIKYKDSHTDEIE